MGRLVFLLVGINLLVGCTHFHSGQDKLYRIERLQGPQGEYDRINFSTIAEDGSVIVRADRLDPIELLTFELRKDQEPVLLSTQHGDVWPQFRPRYKFMDGTYRVEASRSLRDHYHGFWDEGVGGAFTSGLDQCGDISVNENDVIWSNRSRSGEYLVLLVQKDDRELLIRCQNQINAFLDPATFDATIGNIVSFIGNDGTVLVNLLQLDKKGEKISSVLKWSLSDVDIDRFSYIHAASSNGHIIITQPKWSGNYSAWFSGSNAPIQLPRHLRGRVKRPLTHLGVNRFGEVLLNGRIIRGNSVGFGDLHLWDPLNGARSLKSLTERTRRYPKLFDAETCHTFNPGYMNDLGDIVVNCDPGQPSSEFFILRRIQ